MQGLGLTCYFLSSRPLQGQSSFPTHLATGLNHRTASSTDCTPLACLVLLPTREHATEGARDNVPTARAGGGHRCAAGPGSVLTPTLPPMAPMPELWGRARHGHREGLQGVSQNSTALTRLNSPQHFINQINKNLLHRLFKDDRSTQPDLK